MFLFILTQPLSTANTVTMKQKPKVQRWLWKMKVHLHTHIRKKKVIFFPFYRVDGVAEPFATLSAAVPLEDWKIEDWRHRSEWEGCKGGSSQVLDSVSLGLNGTHKHTHPPTHTHTYTHTHPPTHTHTQILHGFYYTIHFLLSLRIQIHPALAPRHVTMWSGSTEPSCL